MAEENDFSIKGAASRSSMSEPSSSGVEDPSAHEPENPSGSAADAEQSKDGSGNEPQKHGEKKKSQDAVEDMTISEQRARYKWFKCKTADPQYPDNTYYYIHFDTQQTTWDEPAEPYWLWDAINQGPDASAGLQMPSSKLSGPQPSKPAEYTGYNPKIHGNYDPNADYAKYHEQNREKERYLTDAQAVQQAVGNVEYSSTMALNRFTGKTQMGDFGPERHSDSAKSGRQMNAFFDVDAAANAHGGRSLKEERRQKKISKREAVKLNERKKAKKEEKQKKWLQN